ncbi:hypothetical protein FIBSPDRAFT_882776 [Athelia psychrophila]|uniref:Uncharacterized protein n=1 Tax=Athelia psychrophila TaxID=1759441 RepID=A0A166UNY5_9AGAM|nr:hypothetical protein FIBSPDRAFT_882776 [Fibularhizoctonia sp. CBS 109695]
MPDNLVSDMLGSAGDNLQHDSPAVCDNIVGAVCYIIVGAVCNNLGKAVCDNIRIAAGSNIRIAEDDNIGVVAGGNIGMPAGDDIRMAAGDDIRMAAGNYTGIAAYNNMLNLVGLRDGRNDLGRYWSSGVSYGSLFFRRIQIWLLIAVEVTGSQDIGNRSTM